MRCLNVLVLMAGRTEWFQHFNVYDLFVTAHFEVPEHVALGEPPAAQISELVSEK